MVRLPSRRRGHPKTDTKEPARQLCTAVEGRETPIDDNEDLLMRVFELCPTNTEPLQRTPHEVRLLAMNGADIERLHGNGRRRRCTRVSWRWAHHLRDHKLEKRRRGRPHDVDAGHPGFASKKVHAGQQFSRWHQHRLLEYSGILTNYKETGPHHRREESNAELQIQRPCGGEPRQQF